MRLRIKTQFALLLAVVAVSATSAVAQMPGNQSSGVSGTNAQSANIVSAPQMSAPRPAGPAESLPRAELALGYSYLHSNAPPNGCGCFNLNGGNATFGWAVKPGRWELVGDVVSGASGSTSAAGYNLILSAFTAGVRYLPPAGHSSLHPFGEVLVGVAHSSGTLVQTPNAGSGNAGAAFASNLGGGLDLSVNHRFSIRLFEADYLLTTFDNAGNNHQNNLRISAGVVFKFGGR